MPNIEDFYTIAYEEMDIRDMAVMPDLQYPKFEDIDVDAIANLGVGHILLDLDGTLVPRRARVLDATKPVRDKLSEIQADSRFSTVSIATESGVRPPTIHKALGVAATAGLMIFSSHYDLDGEEVRSERWKHEPAFWKRILFELDIFDNPEQAVIIGDNPDRDIIPAAEVGLRTVLLDSMVRVFQREKYQEILRSLRDQ